MIDRFHHIFIRPADFDRSLGFYRDVLGWAVTRSWGGEDGTPRGAILSGGGVKVVISETDVTGSGGAGPDLFLDIHDIDARFRSLSKDADVVTPPQATAWGTRWFIVRDPDGNLIAFEEVHKRG